ncbi:hypothetical protein ABK040_013276 [Willaertia magna]
MSSPKTRSTTIDSPHKRSSTATATTTQEEIRNTGSYINFCKVCKKHSSDGISLKLCSKCMEVKYCCKQHQLVDWNNHKWYCDKSIKAKENLFIKKTIKKGNSKFIPKKGDIITIHYIARLLNETVFDKTYIKDVNNTKKEIPHPLQITLGKGEIIEGLEEGLLQANTCLGERSIFVISPIHAFMTSYTKSNSRMSFVPYGMTVVYEIIIIHIFRKKEQVITTTTTTTIITEEENKVVGSLLLNSNNELVVDNNMTINNNNKSYYSESNDNLLKEEEGSDLFTVEYVKGKNGEILFENCFYEPFREFVQIPIVEPLEVINDNLVNCNALQDDKPSNVNVNNNNNNNERKETTKYKGDELIEFM